MKIYHKIIYQGYPGVGVRFRRSPGFLPEVGSVDIPLEFAKKIIIYPREVGWRAVNGFETDGGLDILTWSKLQARATVTTPSELLPPKSGGFNMFGDLKLSSISEDSGKPIDGGEIIYRDIFVGGSGIEEITRLAECQSHSKGVVRVPLTDIRRYYREHSGLFCRINCRLRSGNWDTETLNGAEEAWSFEDVVDYLFSLLPGSPYVHADSEFRGMKFNPPLEIKGEGEPAVEHLEKLLERNGLAPLMLPDGNYRVDGKFSDALGKGMIPAPGKGSRKIFSPLRYERKSYSVGERPAAVLVKGKRRIGRTTWTYIPVLQDTDGKWYRLEDIAYRWGYAMELINKQAFGAKERSFTDVPPSGSRGGGLKLHMQRKAILRKAYRFYAPDFMFPPGKGLSEKDIHDLKIPFLPMEDCAWYVSELERLSINIPSDKLGSKGDQGDFVIMPPVVWANRVGEGYFTEFSRGSGFGGGSHSRSIQEVYDGLTEETKKTLKALRENLATMEAARESAAKGIANSDAVFDITFSSDKAAAKYFTATGLTRIDLGADVNRAMKEIGASYGFVAKEKMGEASKVYAKKIEFYDANISTLEKKIQKEEEKLTSWDLEFKKYQEVYAKRGGFLAIYNLPNMPLEDVTVSVDRETGFLTSTEPLCHIKKPVFFDGDEAEIVSDGAVTVTFGYEYKENNIQGFTNFLFIPSETSKDGEIPKPVLAGVCRSSPIKAKVVNMEGRLYTLDMGTPVNLTAVYTMAEEKAAAEIAVPKGVGGIVYEFSGLRNIPLYAGVTSVQHDCSNSLAVTYVSINAANSRGPLGPGELPPKGYKAMQVLVGEKMTEE